MARKHGKDRGIVFKKDSWWVRLFHNGRERWEKCDSKTQAKAVYGRRKAEIREGRFFPEKVQAKQDITLRAWITRCLDSSINRNRVNERTYARRWSYLLGRKLLTEITTEDLRLIQRKMQTKLRQRSLNAPKDFQPKRLLSDATINRHFSYLRHVLMLALEDEKITRNPFVKFRFLAEVTTTRFLSEEELTRLRGVIAPEAWKLVAFAIETGLRREEQFRLRWDQVDLEVGILALPLPKGGKSRYVPLSEQAKAILRSLDTFLHSPWVFPGVNPSRPMDSRAFLRRAFEPALRRAGISGVSWHKLRHTAASRRVMAGVDLVSVRDILGHRSIQTTLRYSHLDPQHLRNAVNRGSLIETGTKTGTNDERVSNQGGQPLDFVVRPAGIEPATLSLEG
jgi:integrase